MQIVLIPTISLSATSLYQAAVTQATANANVAITTAQGQIATTRAQIVVATYAQDLLVAARELAESRQAFVGAVEQLHTAQLNLTTNAVLVAPHDGIVTAINGTVGGIPGPRVNTTPRALGSADSNVFIQLVDPSHVDQLLLDVNETDIMKVKAGQHVQFTLNAYTGRQFSGTISTISPNGVFVDNMMKYPVIVSIAPASMKGVTLFPNMTTATANIAAG